MYRYNRYISRQLIHSTLLIALSLTAIVWLTQALRLMDFIVNQGIGVDLFLLLTILLLPSLLLMILPIAVFASVAFTYNKLRQESELVVLEAAGLNLWRLARPALFVATIVALLGYAISFYIMPICYGKFREMQSFLKHSYVSVLLQEGVFNSPVDGLTVFVRERDDSGKFRGILVHDSRDPGMYVTMMAEEGKLVQADGGQRFLLTNGNRQEMNKGRLSLLNFESYALDLSFYTKETGERLIDPRELTLPQLLATGGLTDDEIAERWAEAHQRILWPAYAFTMALVGLAFLLSGEFNRRGHVKRVVASVIAITLITVLGITLRKMASQGFFYVALAYANVMVPLVIAGWVLTDRSLSKEEEQALAELEANARSAGAS